MAFYKPLPSATTSLLRMSRNEAGKHQQPQASSRILYDIPCKVCTDHSSGKHYGIFACDGCAGFFKRSIRRNRQYVCKAKTEGSCIVDKTHRNQCRACRLQRCVNVGMNKDAVQHERGPRNSTLRRQMSLYFKDHQTSVSPPPAPTPTSLPFSTAALLAPPPITPPHFTTPLTRPSPPFMPIATPLTSPLPGLPYHLHLSFLQEARRNNGLLMPTPKYPDIKYPHELKPSVTPPTIEAPPPPTVTPPTTLLSENINEMAARLLFMNVKWAQHVPAFTSLPYRDQMLLLEESWRELFVLSSAQFALPVELAAVKIEGESSPAEPQNELKSLQETIGKFQAMNVDTTEFACLRAIILLKTVVDRDDELRDQVTINALQDQAQLTLSKYIQGAYPNQPSRFGKLLLLLPSLKCVSGKTIEELFFKKTIGAIPIERIICDMYKAGAA